MTGDRALAFVEPILAVDPVPWARAQMAFTLAFHIILVPLGVSWAFMALIANYRGIKRNDAAACSWPSGGRSTWPVTFAVGAVTGTVLSFEFGLLWPRFMGQWGEAFGDPVRLRGDLLLHRGDLRRHLHLRLARLKPWAHFWTGVPVVLTGILGSVSVVAANAWMNSPEGFTLDSAGEVVDVDPLGVIFNDAMPLMAAHMVVAAYVVGGFLVASVYAVGMLRGRRDRYHRLGFLISVHRRGDGDPDPDGRRRPLARWVYNNQPVKFAAIELVPETSSDVPETLLGRLNADGKVTGGIEIPGLASWLSDPSDGTSTVVQGSTRARGRAADDPPGQHRPPGVGRDGRSRHAAVPPLAFGTGCAGSSGGTCPRAAGSCASPRAPAWPPSSAWRPAGWSARSAASRGSSTTR